MRKVPQTFHGDWWVPAMADHDTRMIALNHKQMMGYEGKYTGTLTYYGDEDSTLELYHTPSRIYSKHYHQNDVIWGKDANGNIFTLFNVSIKEHRMDDFSCTKFAVEYILIGEHVLSAYDKCYNKCVVQFPYLRNWAFQNIIKGPEIYLNNIPGNFVLIESLFEKNVYLRLRQHQAIERNPHDLTLTQQTTLEIEAMNPVSIWSLLHQTKEFAQFLSIALFGEQSPDGIKLTNKGNNRVSSLLYTKENSANLWDSPLIKFESFKEKLPSMLKIWHENFERIAPISSYLIESLEKKNRFDVPDFLIIAQALDGYHKRFVNSKSMINHKKYEDGIKILLKQFKDVDCIQKCRINPQVLTQTRDKYSHLLTDEDKPLAVEGEDLYWLTEKCKILLTCCILNMLGLSNQEINLCCEHSPISQIIDSLPFEPEID